MAKVKIGEFDTAPIEKSERSIKSLRDEMKALKNEMLNLEQGSDAYIKKAEELGNKQHELTVINETAKYSTADLGQVYSNCTKSMQGLSGAIQGGMAVMNLFGVESEEATETIKKMQSVMALTQSFSALDTGAKAFKGLTQQIKLSSKGLSGFKKALIGTGIGAIVVLVGTLIANWEDLTDAIGVSEGTLNKFKEVASGVGNAIKNFLITPFKVLGKVITGDFRGALDEFKNGMDVVGNYQEGAAKKQAEIQAAANKKAAEKRAEDLNDVINTNEAKYGSDYKYTADGKKAYLDYLDAKIASYDKDSKEYKEAVNNKIKFERECTEKIQKEEEAQAKAREEATKKRNEELKKQKEEAEKIRKEEEKALKDEVEKIASYGRTETENKIAELYKQKEAEIAIKGLTLEQIAEIEKHYAEEIQKVKDDAQKAELDKLEEYKKTVHDAALTEDELQLQELNNKYAEMAKLYEKHNLDKKALDEWYTNEKAKLFKEEEATVQDYINGTTKFAQLSAKQQIEAIATMTSSIGGELNNFLGAVSSNLEEGSKEFKAMQIAMATISMLTGIVSAMTSAFAPTNAYLTIYGQIAMAAVTTASVIASGAANIAKIKATNPNSSGGSVAASTPTLSSSIAASVPTYNINDILANNSAIKSGEATGAALEGNLNSQKVYVVQSDIKEANKKVDVIESEATY